MPLTKRKFLTLMGGGVILAAGTTIGVVASRFPNKALEPWDRAGSLYKEPRRKALSYAILAPNPHNRQPWQVDLSTPDQVKLTVDTTKLLPHTDPFSRQITIGLGCFLEVMRMAAADDGYKVELDLFPEGSDTSALDQRPVAIAHFSAAPNIKPDKLFSSIMQRRTLKEPYDLQKPITDETLNRVVAVADKGTKTGAENNATSVNTLRKLTRDALTIEIETPNTYKESVDLFRIGKEEIETNPDGIDFSGPFFESLHSIGAMTREAALEKGSTVYQGGIDAVLENTDTAMAHLWLVTEGNTRIDQIRAGFDWVRVNLATTAEGVGIQPLSQALQEYPEMKEHYADIHKLLAPEGGTVQMLARLGYAAPVKPSPRWPLEAKIIKE